MSILNVKFIELEEEAPKESLAKPKEAKGEKQPEKPKVTPVQVKSTISTFIKNTQRDIRKMQLVERIEKAYLTIQEFTTLLNKIDAIKPQPNEKAVPPLNEEKRQILIDHFLSQKKLEDQTPQFPGDKDSKKPADFDKVPSERMISVRRLKDKLGIKESKKQLVTDSSSKVNLEDSANLDTVRSEPKQVDVSAFNEKTKDTLKAVNEFLKLNGYKDVKKLFAEMDKDRSGSVDQQEFTMFFSKIKQRQSGKETPLDKRMNKELLTALFKSLDADKSGQLDLKEFS